MYNRQLETFIQVADAGSFSKAAEILFITPTAVTKQINLLERDLGIQLFIRTHRGLKLTEGGKSIYSDAKYIINYSKQAVNRANKAMKKASNTIRIGTSLMTPSNSLVDLWPRIHEISPSLSMQLVSFENTPENAKEILMNLGKNIDVVPGLFDDEILKKRMCLALELSREPICLAMSINHRLAKKDILTIEDLFGENLMLIRRGWNSYVDTLRDDILKKYNKINIKDFEFYNVTVFNQCENSNDILMAFNMWNNVHPLLKIIPIKWSYNIPFGMLYSPNASESVKELISTLSKVIK